MEKEMTGLYLSGHPLDEYKQSLKYQTTVEIEKIIHSNKNSLEDEQDFEIDDNFINSTQNIKDGARIVIGGILTEVNRKVTRNNQIMAFIKLEDLSSAIEIIIFPKILEKYNSLINEDELVIIKGRVSIKEDEMPKVICEEIQPLEKINSSKVYIKVDDEKKAIDIIKILKIILSPYKGDTPIYFFVAKEKKQFRATKDIWIDLDKNSLEFLKNKFGDENVKLVESL